jgi:hypothetical protein
MDNGPWYRLESSTSRINFSLDLIEFNAALVTDLTSGVLPHLLGISYWQILDLFTNRTIEEIQEKLNPYLSIRPSDIDLEYSGHLCASLHQTSGRKAPTVTYFTINNDKLFVSKVCSNGEERRSIRFEEVLVGQYLQPELLARLVQNDVIGFEKLLISVVDDVFSKFGSSSRGDILESIAIECIPKNAILIESGFDYFDLEYAPSRDLTKSHFIFRCVMGLDVSLIDRRYWAYQSRYELYRVICKALGVEEDVDGDIKSEILFRANVLAENRRGLRYQELNDAFFNTTPLYKKFYRYITYRWSLIRTNKY